MTNKYTKNTLKYLQDKDQQKTTLLLNGTNQSINFTIEESKGDRKLE